MVDQDSLTPLKKAELAVCQRPNGHTMDDAQRRGSIRVLLSQTSKALGLPFSNEEETPDSHLNRRFQFQRQVTNSSLNASQSQISAVSSSTNLPVQRCCRRYVSKLVAHIILLLAIGCYILTGTILYVYVIGPEEAAFENGRNLAPFDIDEVMGYLRTIVLNPLIGKNTSTLYPNLDHFRSYLTYRMKAAGVFENRRDFSAVSGILFSVSVISGVGIGNAPRTLIGKAVTFPYCFFGVPLYLLFLYVIGDDLGKFVAVLYHQSACCSMCRHRDKTVQARQFMAASGDLNEGYRRIQACVPVSLMLVLIAFYVLLAVLIFGLWENWNAVNSVYFCVMTLMTVGLVDEIPGDYTSSDRYTATSHIRRALVIVYIICGWLLISACFHAIANRIAMQKKKRNFKLTQQSRDASTIFRQAGS